MASIVLLLSELLGADGAVVLAADRYVAGHQSLLPLRRDYARPASASASVSVAEASSSSCGARNSQRRPAADEKRVGKEEEPSSSFEDLAAVSRIAVDLMWP